MPPGTHLLISWSLANGLELSRRDRILVTLSGVVPDFDGFGYVIDWICPAGLLFERYHHILAHNLLFFLILSGSLAIISNRKFLTSCLAAIAFHLHLLCDLIGARGPDDYQWPIPYLWPFSDNWQWIWEGQWYLHAWPNSVVYGVFLSVTIFIAFRRKRTPVELLSSTWDKKVLRAFSKMRIQ